MARHPPRRRAPGLSLVELLVALCLVSVLLMSLATAGQVFARQAEVLRDEPDTVLEDSVGYVTDAVRHAWWVELAAPDRLAVTDAFGAVTTFELADGALCVARPSGASGRLVDDVESLAIDVERIQRLREAEPLELDGSWYGAVDPGGAARVLTVGPGEAVALGFAASSIAPAVVETVSGVSEELLEASLEELVLVAASLDNCVGPSTGTITVELYEALAPGDPVPLGAALASTSFSTSVLPAATFTTTGGETPSCNGNKVLVCHVPPGNPGNAHTICVAAPAVAAHLAHGDTLGACEETLVVEVPETVVALDLSGLAASVTPGRAHTLVLRVSGEDSLVLRAVDVASAHHSGVAVQGSGGSGFTAQALAVPRTLEGTRTFTQTSAHEVVGGVTVTVRRADGSELTGSATVTSQAAVRDPWHGVVPGELPALELSGS